MSISSIVPPGLRYLLIISRISGIQRAGGGRASIGDAILKALPKELGPVTNRSGKEASKDEIKLG